MNSGRTTFRKYFEQPQLVDRFAVDHGHAVDVIIPILHTNEIWNSNLLSIYREIPVKRLLLGDGGCVDDAIEIARAFPRVHVFDHRSFKSLGYSIRKLIEEVQTEWFIYLHSDVFLPEGWFDGMCAGKDKYDWFECGQNVTVMVQYIPPTLEVKRAYSGTQMGRKDAFARVLPKVDDDFLYRNEDIIFASLINEAGFKYGKVREVSHDHQVMFKESPWLRRVKRASFELELSQEEEIRAALTYVKGIVKYLKPEGNEDLIPGLNENLYRLGQLEAVDPDEFAHWVAECHPAWSGVFPLPEPPPPVVVVPPPVVAVPPPVVVAPPPVVAEPPPVVVAPPPVVAALPAAPEQEKIASDVQTCAVPNLIVPKAPSGAPYQPSRVARGATYLLSATDLTLRGVVGPGRGLRRWLLRQGDDVRRDKFETRPTRFAIRGIRYVDRVAQRQRSLGQVKVDARWGLSKGCAKLARGFERAGKWFAPRGNAT